MSTFTMPAQLAEIIATHRALFGGFVMETDPPAGGQGGDGPPPPGDGFQPITSQEDLNRVIGERLKRAKPADYDDLKAKAAKFDEVEQASKTELQKAFDRAAAAEKKAADLEAAEKNRMEAEARAKEIAGWAEAAAKKHGIPAELIRGADKDEISAHAAALAAAMPNRRGSAPREGVLPTGGTNEMRGLAQQVFAKPD